MLSYCSSPPNPTGALLMGGVTLMMARMAPVD